MKKLLLLGLMLLGMGGVISVQAVRLNATFSTPADNGAWDAQTNTYTWTGSTNNLMTIFTFPNGELAKYTKIHLEVAQGTHHNFRICLMKGTDALGTVTCWSSGPKDITFAEHNDTKNVDLSQVTHIAFGGAEDPGQGNSFSCVLTNVYLEGPAAGYEVEYTAGTPLSLESIVTGNTLVSIAGTDETILYGSYVDNQIYSAAINTAMNTVSANSNSSTYQFRISVANDEGLTLPTGVSTLYRIKAFKSDGETPYTGPGWNGANSFYFNDIGWTYNVVAQDNEGEVACFFGITAVEGKTNTYKITSYKKDGTVVRENIYGKSEWVFYVLGETIVPEKKVVAANDEIFAMSNFTNGKWTLTEPVSLYDWNYLVIATEKTAANASHEILLTDESNKTVRGNDYNGEAVGTGAGMWLDYWNSQNIIAIDLNQLRRSNGLDVFNIVSLEITGDIKPSVVYLTDYANPNLTSRGRWTTYVDGDVKREYSATGKYGTICLPYVASYAGCEIYSIVKKYSNNSISLEKVTGLLEAGKPYFYVSSDENGKDNEGAIRNVNFFRADLDTYDVAGPGTNNGLVGVFATTTAPAGANYWILSGNKLYDTEGCTGDDAVTIGANKAYINSSDITDKSVAGSRTILLSFDGADNNDPTAIESTEVIETLNEGVFYDMSGREVKNPTTGIYIVKYGNVTKKVMIK